MELQFGNVDFSGGRKTGVPGEKPSEQGQKQRQTQPTYGNRLESNPAALVGGELCHHWRNHVPLYQAGMAQKLK